MRPTSIRSLAETCGLSTATISRALTGHPGVRPETRALVAAAARRAGYSRNHLVGAVMSHVRVARVKNFHGSIALIHVPSPGQPVLLPTQQKIIGGARLRAAELGFKLDVFSLGEKGLSLRRLVHVLEARNVSGLIFLYADPTTPMDFPWEKFTSVEIDYGEREPRITTVCIDHYHTLMGAFGRLHSQGYGRIGLFLERFKDDRLWFRFSAAYHSFHVNTPTTTQLPPYVAERMEAKGFMAWYRKNKPDLIVGHVDEAIIWLQADGVRVPETTAFFNLNWTARKRPCAGLDILPELQGSVAAESVIGQVHRHERGRPEHPRNIMIRGLWVDGPTLPPIPGKPATPRE